MGPSSKPMHQEGVYRVRMARDSQGLSNRGPCWVECTHRKQEQLDDSDMELVLHEVKKLVNI
jgi:hypothetical protein